MGSQFEKLNYGTIDSLGTPYDFSSMMHYGAGAFSTGWGRKTIVTKDPSKQRLIGQRNGFSQVDIKQLGLMYNHLCPGLFLILFFRLLFPINQIEYKAFITLNLLGGFRPQLDFAQ